MFVNPNVSVNQMFVIQIPTVMHIFYVFLGGLYYLIYINNLQSQVYLPCMNSAMLGKETNNGLVQYSEGLHMSYSSMVAYSN